MKMKKFVLGLTTMLALSSCGGGKFVLGLGGEGVPVGQYSAKILQYFSLDEQKLVEKGVISYGSDVKAVTTQVKQSLVSAGIIYATDAFSANLKVVDTATKEMCGQVLYPAAVIQNSNGNADAAKSFLSYLTNTQAMDVFKSVGFSQAIESQIESPQTSETVTLKIYAAASMTETMNAIKPLYEAAHSNVTLECYYGSSGTLQTQIEQGPNNCDLFISAGKKQMDALENESLIINDSRINLLENKVALAVPDKNPYNINSFQDLVTKLRTYLEETK